MFRTNKQKPSLPSTMVPKVTKKDEFYDLLRLLQDGRMDWKNKVKGMETKEPSFQSE